MGMEESHTEVSGGATVSSVNLIHGDCMIEMPKLLDNSVDVVIADPPYVLPSKTSTSTKMAERFTKRNVSDLSIVEGYWRSWFGQIKRVLKDTGKFAIFCDETLYTILFRASYNHFDTSLLVWQKGKRVGLGRNYRKTFELIIYGKAAHSPNFTAFRRDIISIDIPSKKMHPAEKPIKLIEYLVEPEDWHTVLDPFMGSGTTGVACVNLKRDFIGIELDETYYEMAQKRIKDANAQTIMDL